MTTFAILLTLYYLMLTYKNPDFKLSTKVQADGRVVIVGIDQYDYECFQLYLNSAEVCQGEDSAINTDN